MKLWIKVAISLLILVALLVLLPLDELRSAFGSLSPSLWLAALMLFLAAHLLGVLKWRISLSTAGAQLSLLSALRYYAAGLFANTWMPGLIGGDVLRAMLAGRQTGRHESSIGAGLLDRAIDLLGLLILLGAGW